MFINSSIQAPYGNTCACQSASGGMPGFPMMMMALQQQLLSMTASLLSSLFGGGAMGSSPFSMGMGASPFAPNFGGAGGFGASGGLTDFLGAPSSAGTQGPRGGKGPKGGPGQAPGQPGGKSKFNVASFNVLGSGHTGPRGNQSEKADGVTRMRGAVATMKKHNVDIAGLQELAGDQKAAFQRLRPNFGVIEADDKAVVWNKDKFKLMEHRFVDIPHLTGDTTKIPVVKLKDKATGKEMWVVNIHNPADTKRYHHNGDKRAKAIKIEQNLIQKLKATGLPVIVTGDFNDGKSVEKSMNQVGMHLAAPNGARHGVDYIIGSNGVNFSNYIYDLSTRTRGLSDHPMTVSTAQI